MFSALIKIAQYLGHPCPYRLSRGYVGGHLRTKSAEPADNEGTESRSRFSASVKKTCLGSSGCLPIAPNAVTHRWG